MRRGTLVRRILSIAVAVAVSLPAFSALAEAAVANWLSPEPGQQITGRNVEVAVGYNTQSDLKVTRLELWVDGRFAQRKVLTRPESRGVCSFWWDAGTSSTGMHDLLAKVYADSDLISIVKSTATVGKTKYDLRPPTVRFTNIKSGDVLKGTTTVSAAATTQGRR